MTTPYWGQLPPPKVARGNSLRREEGYTTKGNNDLMIDTKMTGDRLSSQSAAPASSRQNRFSTQTDKTEATYSTNSPFVSPIASEFRGEGLAPRPPSFQAGASAPVYNKEAIDRRRRRESRNREEVPPQDLEFIPPAAPDAPRVPPPSSYKEPYTNSASSSSYQAPTRSRSSRRTEGPVSSGKAPAEEYHRQGSRDEPVAEVGRARRTEPANGKARVRQSIDHTAGQSQSRKGSLADAEVSRRREWASDRSPLQRLELTLDSITKEEKRARVEEAEQFAREAKAGRVDEKPTQNSVRFRNRPVAKASESTSHSQPQSLPESSLDRNQSTKQKERSPRSGTDERTRPSGSDVSPSNKNQARQESTDVPRKIETATTPKRGASFRERSYIPVATAGVGAAAVAASGLSRSGSNKLKKDPPGDPWLHKRVEAEKKYPEVIVPRKTSVSKTQETTASATRPSKETAFRSHPQTIKEKELPTLPGDSGQDEDIYNDDEVDAKPVRRGTLSKIEQLTGHKAPIPAASMPKNDKGIRTERVKVNGVHFNVSPTISDGPTDDVPRQNAKPHPHLSNILHHKQGHPTETGVYTAPRRLDEWKKGGVALLSGAALDLEVNEKTEAEKDKAWWEAGNTTRRRSSVKQRKAEAYDGEYDDSSGMHPDISLTKNCEGCASERQYRQNAVNLRSRHLAGYDRKTKSKYVSEHGVAQAGQPSSEMESLESPSSTAALSLPNQKTIPKIPPVPILKPHLLTCPMRAIRVRPDIAPTRFKPPLFLKSGPMLRYCGLRREKTKTRSPRNAVLPDREIWRGSIMIVTNDSQSSYELAPTLRLFLQPIELLPPPQFDGEELAPEYVDPLAGLPRMGRDGRTLYIRPVDDLEEEKDLSREESDAGLYEMQRTLVDGAADRNPATRRTQYDGEKAGKYKEVRGFRLHAEHGVTFWRFNLEIELREKQQRIAYRINRGPATGFWVPARGEAMNIMFHSCNGFSHDINPNQFCGPDPMWRDVLNTHQTQPFHVMLGGGDQIYNDRVMEETVHFKEWMDIKNPLHKERLPFTNELQQELEEFYLNRYCMWFSQGLFGLAVSQIPMINIFDDHDIIDGFGSYPDDYMSSPVFSGLGMVAFKYYMLFQHQSSIDEGEENEPTWILGTQPGPYIQELSRSVFTHLGRSVAFLGLDCRTERMYDEVVSRETYDKVFDRLDREIIKGETKHLIVLVGIPVAYPRMVWLENILTSRVMEPVKALGRAGLLGKKLLNHMDGGVEILDDLDDHWTARHHKKERNRFIQELQDIAAEKSVRVTILGGDVHLAAIGQFYSNPKLGIAKDRDFRYMPNIVSSAIVNAPPPDTLADLLNKRNKVHHLDADTDEDMIPIFIQDVNGKPRNNKRLLNRRNWCSIRMYDPELSPPPTPQTDGSPSPPPRGGLLRRLSNSRGPSYRPDAAIPSQGTGFWGMRRGSDAPPVSNAGFFARRGSTDAPPLSNPGFFSRRGSTTRRGSVDSQRPGVLTRTLSLTRKDFMPKGLFRRSSKRRSDSGGINGYGDSEDDMSFDDAPPRPGLRGGSGGPEDDGGYFPSLPPPNGRSREVPSDQIPTSIAGAPASKGLQRNAFKRTPTGLSEKKLKRGGDFEINVENSLDICLNVEINPKEPTGATAPYRILVPALWYEDNFDEQQEVVRERRPSAIQRFTSFTKGKGKGKEMVMGGGDGANYSYSSDEEERI
ncbi:uncharacterized protein LY89DRAFT_776516 [Mollisia scopiformis]|uniref:PhoD-like phosphatase domain-containing protein n=1 Tax=Mollisia scopiformis TaxID=149040 RepID=A0A194XVX7_MOLSC|nr:uncharacterized protein LY89DRAFT_776516 [Mollisia scopiformis]KUJ24388.1 hypothetical protein LY89DRAFT_776516 [Mollisia scopiformis]